MMVKLNDLKKPAPCKFCHQKKDGGVDLLSTVSDLGEFGKLEAGVTMWDCTLNDYPASIRLWMWLDTDEHNGVQMGDEVKLNIKYCPMCGKKLNQRDGCDADYLVDRRENVNAYKFDDVIKVLEDAQMQVNTNNKFRRGVSEGIAYAIHTLEVMK